MNQTLSVNLGDVLTAVEAAGLFVSVCSISAPSQALDALGQVDLSDFTSVSGLQNIPCMKAPLGDTRFFTREIKQQQEIDEEQPFHVLLDGSYPTILQRYQAVIDGEPLDIQAVENDSQGITTRLLVRRYQL